MIASLFHRRRAERFSQLIDEAAGGRRHHTRSESDDDLGSFVSLTRRLSDLPMTVESHPEFREGLRAVLMATIEREGIGATAKPETGSDRESKLAASAAAVERRRTQRRARTFGAVVASLAAGVIALSGVSVASSDANPTGALYGFKRSTERAQLALTASDISKGQLLLDFAKTRLDEARAVTGNPAKFADVLKDMNEETRNGVQLLTTTAVDRRDPAALDVVDAFVADQRKGLTKLNDDLHGVNRTRAEASITLLSKVASRSTALRAILPCGSDATGDVDELGPTPKLRCDAGKAGVETTTPPATTPTKTTEPKVTKTAKAPAGTQEPLTATTDPTGSPTPTPTGLIPGLLEGKVTDVTGLQTP